MWSTKLLYRAPLPRPFFDLPWDIREQIYIYIELDALPPLSNDSEYAGFVLSCKLAVEELSYVATQNYRKYLDKFKQLSKQRTGYTSIVAQPKQESSGQTNPFAHLRQVNVEVRLRRCALSGNSSFTTAWCDMFHSLFGLFLDDVNIHFVATSKPEGITRRGYTDELYNVHCMIRRLFDLIEIKNPQLHKHTPFFRGNLMRLEQKLHRLLNEFGWQVPGFMRTKRVNAKGICFSWNCRTKAQIGSPAAMMDPVWPHTLRLRDTMGKDT